MIAHIKGKIIFINLSYVIIEANNIGYEIKISHNTYASIKDLNECSLFTHLQIKEDAHMLYGFTSIAEKQVFLSLISVKGIGPSAAINILSNLSINDLSNAIALGNHSIINSVKGIGDKTAKRIVLELKDKLINLTDDNKSSSINLLKEEGLAALVKLGISKSIAEKTISEILQKENKKIDLETLIKLALNPIKNFN